MPTTTPFANLITFSRGSNATVVGPNGLVQWAPSNLLTFSEQFDNAAWTKAGATTSANAAVAPDGTYTADTLVDDGTISRHGVNQNPTIAASATYTTSLYVKAGTGRYFTLSVSRAAAGSTYYTARYDLQTATVTATGASGGATYTASSITAVGNGWYRCVLTGVLSTFTDAVVVASSAISPTGFGDRGTEIYVGSGLTWLIWGAQLELGSAATTYNSTTVKNLLGFSEAFDNAAWTKSNSSIVIGAQANPVNGLFNAQKLMENTANNIHYAYQSITALTPANRTFVVSVYAKAAELGFITLGLSDISVGNRYAVAVFNLTNGTLSTSGASDTGYAVTATSITAVGNGWYRCSVTCAVGASAPFLTAAIGANKNGTITAAAGGMQSYTGDGNSGVYIYGAQLSDSASLDPYVPTPGAAPSSTAYYGPRFDYDPVTLQPRGILIEEQRTNLLLRSEEFDNASWIKVDATIAANAATSPDGTANADTATPTPATPIVRQTHTTTTTGAYTGTIWLRSASSTNVTISLRPTGSGSPVSVVCAVTPTWQRFTVNLTAVAGLTNIQFWIEQFSQVIELWGAQLEIGAFATSYIPTIASTVTRSADVATITGQNFGQWYRADEGCFVAEVTPSVVSTSFRPFQASDGTDNERISTTAGAASHFIVTDGGVDQCDLDAGTFTAGTTGKLAVAYKLNDFAASLNGGAAATDTSGTIPTVDRLFIGARSSSVGFLNGHIRSIRYIPARAADFQLQALTT